MNYARPIIRRQPNAPFRSVSAEPLETRRLMDGMAFRPSLAYGHGYGPPPEAIEMAFAVARFEQQQAAQAMAQQASLAASDNSQRVTVTDTAPAPSAAASNNVSASAVAAATSNAVAVTFVPTAKPAQAAADDDGVRQFIADDSTPATPAASTAAANVASAEHVFGPFNLPQPAVTDTAEATPTDAGLASLLAMNGDSASSALRWQGQDMTYRPRRSAEPAVSAADQADIPVVTNRNATQQASILPITTEAAVQSIWQRVILMVAGTTVLVANWIIRRRRQNLALPWAIRRR